MSWLPQGKHLLSTEPAPRAQYTLKEKEQTNINPSKTLPLKQSKKKSERSSVGSWSHGETGLTGICQILPVLDTKARTPYFPGGKNLV